MTTKQAKSIKLEFHPVTPKRWGDFKTLFGEKGACGGCWCMLWRISRKEFEQQKGAANRQAMQAIVESGKIPGLLAYSEKHPVAWCSVAPREEFPALGRSRVLRKIDDEPVWSVSCFFIHKDYRKQGLSVRILEAVVAYVKNRGGRIVEGYPVEPKKGKTADVFAWTGLASFFDRAGFVECARRSATRPIMRFFI